MALRETIAKFLLKKALEKTWTTAKEWVKKSFEIAKSQLSQYLEQKNRAPETIEMTKNLQAERGSILTDFTKNWFTDGPKNEIVELIWTGHAPLTSRFFDLFGAFWWKQDRELYSWQNKFEFITALTVFIPDFLLRYFTNPICDQVWFNNLVQWYPDMMMGEKIKQGVSNREPDKVVDALRVLHQSAMATISTSKELMKKLPKFTA